MRFGVVLVNYHGVDDTIECLSSLTEIDHSDFDIVVVDNGSNEREASYIAENFPSVAVLRSSENLGWSGGNNIGISYSLNIEFKQQVANVGAHWSGEHVDAVLLLNNDTIVDPQIFTHLEAAFRKGFEIVGPVINDFEDREVVQTEGVRFMPSHSDEFFERIPIDLNDADMVTNVDIVNGCAVAIRKSVFSVVGLIDESFFLICEESDFCLRAQLQGVKLGILNAALVYHKHSSSFNRSAKPLQSYYAIRNLWLLVSRYAGTIGRPNVWTARFRYFRYAFHLYSHAREENNLSAAHAICIGVSHALTAKFGAREISSGLLSNGLNLMAFLVWSVKRMGSGKSGAC